jgi:hypothetical protein
VKDNQSGQLGRNAIYVGYCCEDQTRAAEMEWAEKERFLGSKENYREEFGLLQFK